MSWFDVARKAHPFVNDSDYEGAKSVVGSALRECRDSPFHLVLESEFSNEPRDVGAAFTAFYEGEISRIPVGAIYTETNGFDINPDRWYFELFGYSVDQGIPDYGTSPDGSDWLASWESQQWSDIQLTGMEKLQSIYATEQLGGDPSYLSSLLIVIKFQELIYRSRPHMGIGDATVYSTAHEYDFIAKC